MEILVIVFLLGLAMAVTIAVVFIKIAWAALSAIAALAWTPFEALGCLAATGLEAVLIPLQLLAGLLLFAALVVVVPLVLAGCFLLAVL